MSESLDSINDIIMIVNKNYIKLLNDWNYQKSKLCSKYLYYIIQSANIKNRTTMQRLNH